MTRTNRTIRMTRTVVLAGLVAALGGCDLLDVTSPGRIADEDLNSQDAFPGLVAGMSFDMTEAIDESDQDLAMASGELWHGGSYDFGQLPRGVILPEDVGSEWEEMQQARWVAEEGIRRMTDLLGDAAGRSAFIARAYLWAGLANRLLGENLCSTAIDGGAEQPHTVHFDRGLEQFTQAIQVGQATGLTDVVAAAYGGRASMKAWTDDWAGAVSDAQQVSDDFVFVADFTNEVANDISYETYGRFEFSVWGTEFEAHPNDARAPWDTVFTADGSIANGANGSTPHYQQKKYPKLDSDIPLVKGTEMLVLRAEAALRNSQIGAAFDLLNQARAVYGMDPLDAPATLDEAWAILRFERGATNWMETRRLWDRRRWFAEGSGSPAYDPYLEGRDTCFPISEAERRANPNLALP